MKQLSDAAVLAPRRFVWLPALLSLMLITLVAVPTLTGHFSHIIPPLKIDTDPESMLVYDDPVRVTHREQKEKFAIYDLMVVGVVNNSHENGVFNTTTLGNIYDLANYAKTLQWQDANGDTVGVISVELIAPSNVDNIEQGGPGTVRFDWLMSAPPTTEAEALTSPPASDSPPLT